MARKRRAPDAPDPNAADADAPEGPLDPFALFCAYHLGLFPDGRVAFGNVHDVARAFRVSVAEVQETLAAHGLDSDRLVHAGFDIAAAQADVQVSPPGVDLFVLAEMHYEAARAARREGRDWESELAEDQAANRSTYGDDREG